MGELIAIFTYKVIIISYVDFPFLFFMVWPVAKFLSCIILSKNFKLDFLNDLGPTFVSTFSLLLFDI